MNGPRARLLIVEDERIVALNLQQRLESLGYDVPAVAASGAEAIGHAERLHPDLVLMDIRIEGDIDGIETATRLNTRSRVPVVYLTAHSEDATIERARKTEPYGYLLKPFSEREMHATIQMALARRQSEIALEASQARLRESEQRFRELAAHIRDVFFVVRSDHSSVLYVSPAYEAIFGRSCESLYDSADSWFDAVHPEDRARVRGAFEAREPGARYEDEYRIVRPDGSVRWIHVRGYPVADGAGVSDRIAGIAEDVTARVRMAGILREREAALRRAQQIARLAHVVTRPNGDFESWSDTLPTLIGASASTDVPRTTREWLALLHPEDRALFRERAIAAGRTRERTDVDYRLRRLDGRWIALRQAMEPVDERPDAHGRTHWFSTMQDITGEQRSREEIRRLNADLERRVAERTAELEAANRDLEAYDRTVAHDLRAPVRHMLGFAGMLAEDLGERLEEPSRSHLARLVEAGGRMSELVDDLFALSTLGRGEVRRTIVDLSAMAQNVLDALRRAAPGREVEGVVEPGLLARADAGLMTIVLENLLGNAFKFTSRRSPARIEFGCRSGDGQVPEYFVRDDGAGFDMQAAGRLFSPFQRLHADFEGTGLGLATVHRIVARHGGRVRAESAPDQGATFYFTLSPNAPAG